MQKPLILELRLGDFLNLQVSIHIILVYILVLFNWQSEQGMSEEEQRKLAEQYEEYQKKLEQQREE